MNSIYIGQCDRIRKTEKGEMFWQLLMRDKRNISKKEFLKHVDPSNILDEGETVDDFLQGDPDAYFAKSLVNGDLYYFIGTCGFEFIWKV